MKTSTSLKALFSVAAVSLITLATLPAAHAECYRDSNGTPLCTTDSRGPNVECYHDSHGTKVCKPRSGGWSNNNWNRNDRDHRTSDRYDNNWRRDHRHHDR